MEQETRQTEYSVADTTAYRFDVGDVVKCREDVSICSPANPDRQYKEGLTVSHRFYDGMHHVYILRTGDGNVSVFGLERDFVLQQRGEPQKEEMQTAEPQADTAEMEALLAAERKRSMQMEARNTELSNRINSMETDRKNDHLRIVADLLSVKAMLRHTVGLGTHRQRDFYAEAVIKYIDSVKSNYDEEAVPF